MLQVEAFLKLIRMFLEGGVMNARSHPASILF